MIDKQGKKKFTWNPRVERQSSRARNIFRIKNAGIKKYVGTVLMGGFLAGTIAIVALFAWAMKDFPDPNNLAARKVAQTTTIYDRTGEVVLYQIHGRQKRTLVTLDQITDFVKKATISAEDRNFYNHGGFDPKGMVRGLFRSIVSHGQNLQSGSTITQQFIKKSVLTDEQTVIRKIKELVLAVEIERRYSKDEILQMYLNEIPYGSVAYGIESAAQTFFGKSAKDLTLSESALLASLPNAPTYFSPYGSHLDALIARQHYVLDGMVTEGYVTKEEAEDAKKDDILKKIKPKREPIVAPHFVFYVRELLADKFGEQAVEQGGLKVITTLDAKKQEFAEKAIADNLDAAKKYGANTAAMAAVDPRNGDVLAMVGSADYFDDEINGKYNAVLGKLQPGSSIKPVVYAAAFEKGYTPSTVVEDLVTNFSTTDKPYEPHNYSGTERGFVTLKEALAGSLNIPAVKVLYLTGLDSFQDFAERMGYTTFADKSRYGLSLTLGGAEVKPLEHINAFGAFAQEGTIHPSRAILKVLDASGKTILDESEAGPGKKIFGEEIARQINDILSDNSARAYVFGENNHFTLGDRPVAAKSGTTNDFKDAWTVGYVPSLVSGVWVGEAHGKTMKLGADGSKIAAPIWNQFMRTALAGASVETFTPPQPVVTGKPVLDGNKNAQVMVKVDRVSGKLATELTPPEYVEERGYGIPHSILFFVDKNDPRGPVPQNPENEPQYAAWEKAVAKWSEGKIFQNSSPPTEFDDIHVPENFPTVSIISPSDSGTVSERTFRPTVSTFARRGVAKVDYLVDGDLVGSSVFSPFDGPVTIPNRFAKGFHTLTARAFDDVGNRSESSVTFNLTAEPGPLGIRWNNLYPGQYVYGGAFPLLITFTIEDKSSLESIRLYAKDQDGIISEVGTIENPPLPGMAVSWNEKPRAGNYTIVAEAHLKSGDVRSEEIRIKVE